MKIYRLERTQVLPTTVSEAWDFFATPANLNSLTPKEIHFEVKHVPEGKTYPGMMIQYRIKAIAGIPMNWVTEITHVVDQSLFVDEQRFGPYRLWHHEHHFRALPDGTTEMIDRLSYALPFGLIGNMAWHLGIGKKVTGIFDYRAKRLKELFPGA